MTLPNVTLSMRFHHTRFDVNELKVTLDDVFSKHDEVHGQMTEEEPLKYDNWKKGLKSAESRIFLVFYHSFVCHIID